MMIRYNYYGKQIVREVQAALDYKYPTSVAPVACYKYDCTNVPKWNGKEKQMSFKGTAGFAKDEPDWFNYPLTGYFPC
jgi:hypothetical protein